MFLVGQRRVFGVRDGFVVAGGGGGEQLDGVGDQSCVLVDTDLVIGVSVGDVFGGHVQQIGRCPLLGVDDGDFGDQGRPGRIGHDGFGCS
ncbi:Uncharacterised protein [Mycobacteroides abscessus subsp. abscessus]|nr:Uncharacterised protein [Mycobacteroides abscessus subsp. abscessus]